MALSPEDRARLDKVIGSTTVQTAAKSPSLGQRILDTARGIVSSEAQGFKQFGALAKGALSHPIEAGKDLATPVVAQLPSVKDARAKADQAAQQEQTTFAALVKKRNALYQAGHDTTALTKVIDSVIPKASPYDALSETEKKTKSQVAGDFIGTAADTLSGGLGGAKLPALITEGAGLGYGQDVSRKLTEGRTDAGVAIPGIATAVGALAPLVGPAIEGAGNIAPRLGTAAKNALNTIDKVGVNQDKVDRGILDLVTPELSGKKLLGAIKSGKVTEGSMFGTRDFSKAVPYLQELAKDVATVPGIRQARTMLEKNNAVVDEIGSTAEQLISDLKNAETQVGTDRGFFTPNEFKGYMNGVKAEIRQNPFIVGDSQKVADKIAARFEQLVKEEGYTPSGLLSARKRLDSEMSAASGEKVFDQLNNAKAIALRAIRQGGNEFLASKVPNVEVKALLKRQSNLYRALDNIAPKADKEGANPIARLGNRNKNLKRILKYGLLYFGAREFRNELF